MNDDAQEAALALLGLSPINSRPTQTIPRKRKQQVSSNVLSTNPDSINCICGVPTDDGFSIACDDCQRWCHAACFDIIDGQVPDVWKCWVCAPKKGHVGKHAANPSDDRPNGRRKSSPGAERKRRLSTVGDVNRRKRRASISVNTSNLHPLPASRPPTTEDDYIDIDEPWAQQYVPISQNQIHSPSLREKLQHQAQRCRGVSALQSKTPYPSTTPTLVVQSSLPTTSIQALPPAEIARSNAHVVPPSYALHTTQSVPSSTLIKEYVSIITASSSYLSDPLNSYATLGIPKPFVHLLGPPLDVALDARVMGGEGRFARSGCRPNAVLRPFICPSDAHDGKEEATTLRFAIFALRDLKPNEEVVLGWEWDDNHAVHELPVIIDCPHAFPPQHLQHVRMQMMHVLHSLGSTFTTCACGAKAKDCALKIMAQFIDGEVGWPEANVETNGQVREKVDLGPLIGVKRRFGTRERIPFSGGLGGVMMDHDEGEPREPIAGPSNTRNGEDQEMADGEGSPPPDVPILTFTSPTPSPQKWVKGKGRIADKSEQSAEGFVGSSIKKSKPWHSRRDDFSTVLHLDAAGTSGYLQHDSPSEDDRPVIAEIKEEKMPPRMRKRWIHKTLGDLLSVRGKGKEMEGPNDNVIDIDSGITAGTQLFNTPDSFAKSTSSTFVDRHQSPSSRFARLSLLSPIMSSPILESDRSTLTSMDKDRPDRDTSTSFHSIATVLPDSSSSQEVGPLGVKEGGSSQAPLMSSPQMTSSAPVPSERKIPEPFFSPITSASERRPAFPEQESLSKRRASPPAPGNSSTTIQGSAHHPMQSVPLPASPPPPPKVKLTLKDFALRRKRQREEEKMATMHADATHETSVDNCETPSDCKEKSPGKSEQETDAHLNPNPAHVDYDATPKILANGMKTATQQTINAPTTSAEHAILVGAPRTPDPTPILPSTASFLSHRQTILDSHRAETPPLHDEIQLLDEMARDPRTVLDRTQTSSASLEPLFSASNGMPLRDGSNRLLNVAPSSLPTPPLNVEYRFNSFRPSQANHEEGEIVSTTPAKTRTSPSFTSRGHTPPTQPRSFSTSAIPSTGSPSPSTRRVAQPPGRRQSPANSSSNAAPVARPLPSGPRALRTTNHSSVWTSPPRALSGASSPFIPRGPSADRDRFDWDRERSREWQSKPRGRSAWPGR